MNEIKCYDCETAYTSKKGSLELPEGKIEDVEYRECGKCGGLLFPRKTVIRIESGR